MKTLIVGGHLFGGNHFRTVTSQQVLVYAVIIALTNVETVKENHPKYQDGYIHPIYITLLNSENICTCIRIIPPVRAVIIAHDIVLSIFRQILIHQFFSIEY